MKPELRDVLMVAATVVQVAIVVVLFAGVWSGIIEVPQGGLRISSGVLPGAALCE